MKRWISLITFFITLNASAMGRAPSNANPVPSASPKPTSSTAPIAINPDSLRQYLLSGNYEILQELVNVYRAKDERLAALGGLAPSLSLGAVLGAVGVGPMFLLASIQFLVPFLVPDNWINLSQSEHVLNAEESSYLILELNQYASAYSLYETVINDLEARDVLQQNYDTLYQLYLNLALQNQQTGSVTLTDVLNAQEKEELARGPLVEMQKVIDIDTAALREALGLALDTPLTFSERVHVPPVSVETQDPQSIAKQGLALAPENAQLSELLAAGEDAKLAAEFGFVNSATLFTLPNTAGSGPKSVSFSNLIGMANVSIGFAFAPTIQLTNDNIDNIKNQQMNLDEQIGQIAETSVAAITAAKTELATYQSAEDHAYTVYLSDYVSYGMGTVTLTDVLLAESDYFTAAGQRVQAQTALDNARITLHRMMLTDQFSGDKIQGCNKNIAAVSVPSGFIRSVENLFNPSSDRVTLDQMCKAPVPGAAPSPSPAGAI